MIDPVRNELRIVADRHNVSLDAVEHLYFALVSGNGTQAQFNHPELGGFGQWSQGGMLMIGDMFNYGLKSRVAALCSDIAPIASQALYEQQQAPQQQSQYQGNGPRSFGMPMGGSANWWPQDLGAPSATGSQNDLRYAFFPATQRLALSSGGAVTIYDTKDHNIGGFSQQQSGDQSVTFNSQYGQINLAQLEKISPPAPLDEQKPAAEPQMTHEEPIYSVPVPFETSNRISPQTGSDADIFDKIERLASLHQKGILTAEEFTTKKTELLARL